MNGLLSTTCALFGITAVGLVAMLLAEWHYRRQHRRQK